MASPLSVLKKVVPLNHVHVEGWETVTRTVERFGEPHEVDVILVHARPFRRDQCRCPECMRRCERDGHRREGESSWRAPDLDGVPVYLMYRPQRIKCPAHGEINEWVPWADGRSRFTAGFNDEAAWLACQMSRTAVSCFMGINWRTVGGCVRAAHDRMEPDVSARIHCGLRAICVDETSYSRGRRYVTVVYDMDRNRVVWVRDRHGRSVFEEFCLLLTEEERAAVEVVAGDGARWIDECVSELFPNAARCVDFFHVVQWANDALDGVRLSAAAKARRAWAARRAELEAEEAALAAGDAARARADAEAELAAMPRRGRPSKRKLELLGLVAELDAAEAARAAAQRARRGPGRPRKGARLAPERQRELDALAGAARAVKGAKHALGHSPENRTASQDQMVALIEAEQPDLWAAYQLKERLRLILHLRDADEAAAKLDEWVRDASSCGLAPMEELAGKIARHREGILNSVRLRANSAKSEACNTTIKALVKVARGFRNLDNMIALIYLKCSDLVVPLHNRPQPPAEWQKRRRDEANERRRAAEELRRIRVVA